MSDIRLFIVVSIAATIVLWVSVRPASASDYQCDTKVVARVSSPYHETYDALVQVSVCSTEGMGSTVVTNEVAIVPHGSPMAANNIVYGVEIGSDVNAYVAWLGEKQLMIVLPETLVDKRTIAGPFGIKIHVLHASAQP